MEPTDLTIQVLLEIRDEVKQTNVRLDETNLRLDETYVRLSQMGHRQTETEIRLVTEIVAVAAAVREVRDELREDRILRARVDDHERRIGALEKGRSEAAH